MDLSVSFYKKDVDSLIAAFKKNDLNTAEKIHLKHQTESGRMKVLLPVIQLAADTAQKDPSFARAVSEYVTLQGLGLNEAQQSMLRALRRHDLKTARATCPDSDDAAVVLKAISAMPYSAAYSPVQAYQATYGGQTAPETATTLKSAKKAFTPRIV